MTETEATELHSGCCVPGSSSIGLGSSKTVAGARCSGTTSNWCVLPGGWFAMGADDGPYPQDGEGPQRQVFVDEFSISSTAVSNKEFTAFVSETKYQTVAEELGWSFVFHMNLPAELSDTRRAQHAPWWCCADGACWSSPLGMGSTATDQSDHPVVHITMRDALAFCQWADCRLPTEAEWEYAARGGLDHQPFPWGAVLEPNGDEMSNIWKGTFPDLSTKPEGFAGTVSVTRFPSNGFGLHNTTGNVWEWTADRFTHLHSPRPTENPTGPLNGDRYVAKGGSYLCHASYCARYRTSSRQAVDPFTVADNIGFRIVRT